MQKIKLLRQFGIDTLHKLHRLDEGEMRGIFGIDKYYLSVINQVTELLINGYIPVNQEIESTWLAWIDGEEGRDNYTVFLKMADQTYKMYEGISVENLIQSSKYTKITIISEVPLTGQFNLSWKSVLQMKCMLGRPIRHNDLMKKFNVSLDISKPPNDGEYFLPKHIYLKFLEVEFLISRMYHLKQLRRSSINESSVNKTANKPPRL